MRSELNENLKEAIKSQEKQRVATLRLINAAIKDLISAFKKKSLINTFENEDYFNIKKMQKINLV